MRLNNNFESKSTQETLKIQRIFNSHLKNLKQLQAPSTENDFFCSPYTVEIIMMYAFGKYP